MKNNKSKKEKKQRTNGLWPMAMMAFVAAFAGCKKLVEVPLPEAEIQTVDVFSSDATAVAALHGLYAQMTLSTLSFANGGLTLYPALTADELVNTSPSTDLDPFRQNEINPTNSTGLNNRLWSSAYRTIYHANAIIEGATASAQLSDSIKKIAIGESKLVRAFYYHYLVKLFGDVPLVLATNYGEAAVLPRTAKAVVQEQLIRDLLEAKEKLGETYPVASKLRPNKWAAATLLARVYLEGGNWQEAAAEASAVINAGRYSLTTLNNVFKAPSSETIWQLGREAQNTAEGAAFIPSSSTVIPPYLLRPELIAAFEPADGRKAAWVKTVVLNGQTYHYPFKYTVRSGTTVTENYVVLRLAECYLIRAEAWAKLGKLAEAAEELNRIRGRAGLPGTTAATAIQLQEAIARERQVEFFTEWGHRWFDLLRQGKADAVLGSVKGATWQPTDKLYPLPLSEIEKNPYLTQNPGY